MIDIVKHRNKLQQTFKSADTEEFLDIYFNRPIGYLWALFFKKLHIHPNVVTIFSIFLGIGAGIAFYFSEIKYTVLGIFLLMWANHFDSADGQLARMTGKKTRWGRMLDGFAGDIWFITIYASICLRLMNTPIPFTDGKVMWGFYIWILAYIAGIMCHSRQCVLADYYRNIHLFFLKGKAGSELDNCRQQREMYESLPWKKNFWWKIFLFSYANYTGKQEKMTPRFQVLYSNIKKRYGDNIPDEVKNDFLELSRPLMKYTNILTFNTRAIVLYISLLIGEPWLYFVFEIIVLSNIFIYMHFQHEKLSNIIMFKYFS